MSPMPRPLRIAVLVATVLAAISGVAAPVGALSDGTVASDDACVVADGAANAVRALLTPGTPVAEDVAFNRDDPDAEKAPLELIRFPEETAPWVDVPGEGMRPAPSADSGLAVPTVRALAFTGSARQDRAVSDSIVRLYCGLFDRRPSSLELEYWAGRYWNGLPLVTIAEAMTHATEFVARYGIVTDPVLIGNLYSDVLGRSPGVGGVSSLEAKLASGEMHRGEVIVQFTESSEYVYRTGTVEPRKPELPYPDVGSGRRIILRESAGRVWLVEATGELFNTHQVSNRRGIPGVGRYNVYSKSRYAWAPHDGITMEYMVRFARGEWPYGFHSIPVRPGDVPMQTPAELGTYRSGGCVRQLWDDAKTLFGWAEIGDRVLLIP